MITRSLLLHAFSLVFMGKQLALLEKGFCLALKEVLMTQT